MPGRTSQVDRAGRGRCSTVDEKSEGRRVDGECEKDVTTHEKRIIDRREKIEWWWEHGIVPIGARGTSE